MNAILFKAYVTMQTLINGEEGQDLVEYALLVSLIALATITSVGNVASAINSIFTNVSTSIV